MEQYVQIIIDGARVKTPRGNSVLDACMEYGVCIPHLCHVPNIPDLGACRLCIVEHVQNGRTKITTSCTLKTQEGMVINTNSPKIRRMRRNIAELLVAEAPNSRAVQDIAVRCGVKDVRYPFRHNTCTLCGRCVRVCNDMWQAKAIGFIGRGKDRHVDFPFGVKPEFCKDCNTCIDLCPMTITPCDGPMKKGEEYLCGHCEAQLMTSEDVPDTCVWCDLGQGFQCARQNQAGHAHGA